MHVGITIFLGCLTIPFLIAHRCVILFLSLDDFRLTRTNPPFRCSRINVQMVLKTFDPAAFDRHVLAEETRLLEAIAATLKEVRAMTNDTADRPMVNRNRVSFMLEKHLGRFPDPDEVEALWSRRVEASAVLWSEGGDLVRDQSEMYSDQIQYGSHMDSL